MWVTSKIKWCELSTEHASMFQSIKHNGAATITVRMHKTCSEMIGFIWGSTEKVYSVYVAKVA